MLGLQDRRSISLILGAVFSVYCRNLVLRILSLYKVNYPKRMVGSFLKITLLLFVFLLVLGCTASVFGNSYSLSNLSCPSQTKLQLSGSTGNLLVLSLHPTNVTCNGQTNGSIGSVVTGSSGGTIQFTLSPGSVVNTTGNFSGLSAGTYTVTADDGGILATASVTLNEPSLLAPAIIAQSNVLCRGNANGMVTVGGNGGSSGYSYSINGGLTYQASGTFNALTAGNYTVRVKDSNGCIADQSVSITEPGAALAVTATTNNPVCSNGVLVVMANPTGGTAPYTYSWTGPNAFSSTQQSPVIFSPTASNNGNYSVTVKDANNCTVSNSVNVIVSVAPIVTATASINTICAGGSVTLGSSSDIPITSPLPAPVYTASNNSTGGTVSAAAWTTVNDGVSINGLIFHSNDNSSFYLSDSRTQNGFKTETALKSQAFNTNGYSALNLSFWHYYRFGGGINESARVQVSTDGITWTNLATYTATIGGCSSFVKETINLDSYINKSQLYFRFYYYSESRARYWAIDNAALSGTSSAGLPVISWSSNPAGFTSNLAAPPAVSPNVTTTYTVNYTNPATGCSGSASTKVVVNPTPNVAIQPNYCAVPGHVQLTAQGGSTYTWTTGETSQVILTDIADTYGVSSTNSYGCTGSAFLPVSTELVVNGDFSAGNTGFTNAYGYTTAANGLFPEGLYAVGNNPTFYHTNFWGRDKTTNSGNFLIVNGIGSAGVVVWQETVSVLKNTNYYFSAWAISLNSVPPYANLQFNVNGTLVGTTAPLAARPANNNPPYDWQRFYGNWNSGNATTAVIQIVDLQTALGGNDFGLDDVSFGTLAPIPFSISPGISPSATICSGKTMYLKTNIVGGRAPVTYSWSGPNGFSSSQKDPVIPKVTEAYSGTYILSVRDGYGCDPVMDSVTAKILPSPQPLISSINGTATVCPMEKTSYWTTQQNNVTNNWSVTGGAIIGSASKDTVLIQWGLPGSGLITLKATNSVSLCDSVITKNIGIQDLTPPTIECPKALSVSGKDETAINQFPFSSTASTISLDQLLAVGGNATDDCGLASITYQDVKAGTNPMVVTRSFTAFDYAGNKNSCNQVITIADDDPPTLTVPSSYEFCVEDLISASIVSSSLKISPAPDYFLFRRGSTALDLNPVSFSDDHTPVDQLILHWSIDFSPILPLASISGTGEPSAYVSDILFPGDGTTFLDMNHTITYWLVDLAGNESIHKSVPIVIHPRPLVAAAKAGEKLGFFIRNPKTINHGNIKI